MFFVLRRIEAFVHSWRTRGRGLWLPLGLLVGVFLAQGLAAMTPWLIERVYIGVVYPRLLSALSSISRGVRFSFGETAISLLVIAICIYCVRVCILLVSHREDWPQLLKGTTIKALWLAAILLWCFLFTFGFNYQRPLLFELLGYEQRKASALELQGLSAEIVRGVNENYLAAHAEGRTTPDSAEILALLRESFDTTRDFALLPRGDFSSPKPAYYSGLLTRLGISGFYFPLTGEPHYNADAPDFQMPFSAAHEMAHQRGVARESEANFVAYLVCINSRDPFVRYSGYRNGLGVLSELSRLEPEWARSLARQLGPGYREDSRRAALFWAKAAGTAGALSQRINDLYLRANRVKSGVNDYSGSTALIIGHYLRQMSKGENRPAP
jgi:hypothetical protein